MQACKDLKIEAKEKELTKDVKDILSHLSDNPTTQSKHGEVFVTVKGENPEIVYNVPASLMTVFPGEEHGLNSSAKDYRIAVNTYRTRGSGVILAGGREGLRGSVRD